MSDYKYPYIPKEYYAAVMYACSCIRKYGTFNVACNAAAKRFGVDADIVAEHVRKRQAAGQKGTSRKYYYFAVVGLWDRWLHDYDNDIPYSEADPDGWLEDVMIYKSVIKATNEANARKQIPSGKLDRDYRLCGETVKDAKFYKFDNEKDARDKLKELVKEKINEVQILREQAAGR